MKRYAIVALAFVLTAAMLTGCRGRNEDTANTSESTMMPTVEMPTAASTEATSAPTTEAPSMPSDATGESATQTVGTDGFVDSEPSENGSAGNNSKTVPGNR